MVSYSLWIGPFLFLTWPWTLFFRIVKPSPLNGSLPPLFRDNRGFNLITILFYPFLWHLNTFFNQEYIMSIWKKLSPGRFINLFFGSCSDDSLSPGTLKPGHHYPCSKSLIARPNFPWKNIETAYFEAKRKLYQLCAQRRVN